MSAARWQRLAGDLAAAGVPMRLDEKPYSESVRGRSSTGVSRSLFLRLPGGDTLEISDQWWRKNPDFWIGWCVTVANRHSITTKTYPLTKKRADVVASVLFEAIGLVPA